MALGFLGTVIGLERAVALGSRWTFAVPLLSGGGAIVLVAGASITRRRPGRLFSAPLPVSSTSSATLRPRAAAA